jgi:hypothetical protein
VGFEVVELGIASAKLNGFHELKFISFVTRLSLESY